MTAITPAIFSFESHIIRTAQDDQGNPLFCAADICNVLGYKNSRLTTQKHCKEDGVSKRYIIDSMGREQEAAFITEGNLYRLIIKSHRPEAERFERWLMDEALPTIRKTGKYEAQPATEYITSAHYHLIRQRIGELAYGFWFTSAAEHALWKALRQQFGLHRAAEMPIQQFDQALALLDALADRKQTAWHAKCQFESRLVKWLTGHEVEPPISPKLTDIDCQQVLLPH